MVDYKDYPKFNNQGVGFESVCVSLFDGKNIFPPPPPPIMNIWIAASDGREDLVLKFIKDSGSGLTANSKDPNGYTPIHAAAAYGHVNLLKTLCNEYGGDINIKDNDGDTPLFHCEDVNTARVILEELGGHLDTVNEEGKTALQVLEEDNDFPELIDYLRVKSGLEPLQPGGNGASTGTNATGGFQLPSELDSATENIDPDTLKQFKDSIRYTLENDPVEGLDEEALGRRKQLEAILQCEDADAQLEAYVRELVRSQLHDWNHGEDQSSKRQK